MNQQQLERDVRFLKRYAMVDDGGARRRLRRGVQAEGVAAGRKAKFTEIDVERINIVEPDGK